MKQEKANTKKGTVAMKFVRGGRGVEPLPKHWHVKNAAQNKDQRLTIDNLVSGKAKKKRAVRVNSKKKLTRRGK